MRIEQDIKLDFKDVLLRPKRSTLSSRKEVKLERHYKFLHSPKTWTGIGIASANMDTTGTFAIAEKFTEYKMLTCIHKHYSLEEWDAWFEKMDDKQKLTIPHHIAVTSGTNKDEYEKLKTIVNKYNIDFICLDVANGYQESFIEFVKQVRNDFKDKIIIAGNVVSKELTEALVLAGADIIKTGVGPGFSCSTRVKTAVGVPQLSTIIECADSAHGLGGHLMSDGGLQVPGDFSRAFAAGADFVMVGSLFAGHDESGGEIIEENHFTGKARLNSITGIWEPIVEIKKFKTFYGMSSDTAMNKYNGGVANYRASEGRTIQLPYRGSIENTIHDILGGIRSTCTYIGAKSIKDMPKCATFVIVNRTHGY